MFFCTRCGAQLTEGTTFYTNCGTPASQPEAVPHSTPVSATTPIVSPAEPQRNASQQPAKRGGRPVLLVVVGVILLGLVAGAAGLVYVGYKVKQKATALVHGSASSDTKVAGTAKSPSGNKVIGPAGTDATNHQDDGVDKGLDAIGALADRMGFGGPPPDPYSDLEVVKKVDASSIQCPAADTVAPADAIKPTSGRVPMRVGLIVTSTWGRKQGDVDDIVTLTELKPDTITTSSNGLKFDNDDDAKGHLDVFKDTVCAQDLRTAHGYMTGMYKHAPEVTPGITRQRLSAAAFEQLKQTGKLSLRYMTYVRTPDDDGFYKHWQDGEITRVEPNDIPYSVIVNDVSSALPVIHAHGIISPEGKAANKDAKYAIDRPTLLDLKVSDDPLNPLVLFFKFEDDPFRIEVTKIQFPNQEKRIEQELSKDKKALVYGIYFDFNSDKIKPESKQILDEIAEALRDNPDWKLTVDGHTDNVGGDAYNLDLSKRRSASVKQALVTRYHINPDRLSSTGSGVAGAIDTNDTIIGRSHNRRVELTRQ